jgi:hypothetical protein
MIWLIRLGGADGCPQAAYVLQAQAGRPNLFLLEADMHYDFYRIPGTVLRDKSISALSRLLYGVIYKYSYNGRAEFCWAGDKHLADIFGQSPRTMRRCIKELIDHEYVEAEYCKGKTRKLYPTCELEVCRKQYK